MNKWVIKRKDLVEYIVILVFVMATGSLYFQILRMPLMAVMMLVCVVLISNGKFRTYNLLVFGSITLLFLITSIINYNNGFRLNDLIIWGVNVIFVISIQSNMKFKDFTEKYIIIMAFEAAISIICFMWTDVFTISELPLLSYHVTEVNEYYLTPYYTVGWGAIPVFHRNAGMFSEPGSHQVMLNFALLFVLSSKCYKSIDNKKRKIIIAILVTAVLTTQSTMGYMCLAVVLIASLFIKKEVREKTPKFKFAIVLFLVLLVFVESNTGVIEDKIEGRKNSVGSFNTRMNDTLSGFSVAMENPVFGKGVFQSEQANMLEEHDVINISNGLASFSINAGFFIAGGWLVYFYHRIRKLLPFGVLYSILVFTFYIMCINSQGMFLNILFLMFMAPWVPSQISINKNVESINDF